MLDFVWNRRGSQIGSILVLLRVFISCDPKWSSKKVARAEKVYEVRRTVTVHLSFAVAAFLVFFKYRYRIYVRCFVSLRECLGSSYYFRYSLQGYYSYLAKGSN